MPAYLAAYVVPPQGKKTRPRRRRGAEVDEQLEPQVIARNAVQVRDPQRPQADHAARPGFYDTRAVLRQGLPAPVREELKEMGVTHPEVFERAVRENQDVRLRQLDDSGSDEEGQRVLDNLQRTFRRGAGRGRLMSSRLTYVGNITLGDFDLVNDLNVPEFDEADMTAGGHALLEQLRLYSEAFGRHRHGLVAVYRLLLEFRPFRQIMAAGMTGLKAQDYRFFKEMASSCGNFFRLWRLM